MLLGRKKADVPPETETEDPTSWLIDSGLAEFLLLHTAEMRYMAMLCYTFLHGKSACQMVRLLIRQLRDLVGDQGGRKSTSTDLLGFRSAFLHR